MNIKVIQTVLLVIIAFIPAQILQAQLPCSNPQNQLPMIDDFTTGRYRVNLRQNDDTNVQRGAKIAGCFRLTHFIVPPDNQFNQHATLNIRRQGTLIVSSDYKVFHRLEVTYGVDAQGQNAPLNLNLRGGGYDRFRVHFDGNDLGVNFNIVVFDGSGNISSRGFNVDAGTNPFDQDFLFDDFVSNGTPADFTTIAFITLVFQSGSAMGSNDYAITSFEVANGPVVP